MIGHQTGATAFAERIRIDVNGNVGRGTTAPMSPLQIGTWSGSAGGVQLEYPEAPNYASVAKINSVGSNTDTGSDVSVIGLNLHNNASVTTGQRVPAMTFSAMSVSAAVDSLAAIDAVDAGPGLDNNWRAGALAFHTASATHDGIQERMRIDSSGKVGIGTTAPTENCISMAALLPQICILLTRLLDQLPGMGVILVWTILRRCRCGISRIRPCFLVLTAKRKCELPQVATWEPIRSS